MFDASSAGRLLSVTTAYSQCDVLMPSELEPSTFIMTGVQVCMSDSGCAGRGGRQRFSLPPSPTGSSHVGHVAEHDGNRGSVEEVAVTVWRCGRGVGH